MPRDLIVRVLGNTTQFERSLARSTTTATGFERTLKRVAITAQESASAQINAAVRKDARLREEITTYRAIAASAQKGSREQIAAANLAARSERTLARSLATTSAESKRLSVSTRGFDRDFSRASRGALAGSGIFRGLGRSLAFASGGFLAFGGAAAFVRKSIDAAETSEKAQRALATAIAKTGGSAKAQLPTIDAWAAAQARFGVSAADAETGLGRLVELTGSTSKAMKGYTAALEISKATGKDFNAVSLAVGKALDGQTTALARYIGRVRKGTTDAQLLALVNRKFGGQAAANTTEIERFNAELANTEEIVGRAILPTLNKYLVSGSRWLQQMNESGQLEKDVAGGAHAFTAALHDSGVVIHDVDRVTGGFVRTVELLLALKTAAWARTTALELGLIGTKATVAEGELSVLQTRLAGMSAAKFVIPVVVAITAEQVGQALHVNTNFTPGKFLDSVEHPFRNAKGPLLNFLLGNGFRSDTDRRKVFTPTDVGLKTFPEGIRSAIAKALDAAGFDDSTTSVRGGTGSRLTAGQRNTFFDNTIARILLRGGLGGIQKQIAALEKADRLIEARLRATHDVTRRLRLEDELLSNEAQIGSLRDQQAATAAQAAADRHQKLVDALARRATARQGRQFRELGFTATGENVIPGVGRLKRELGTIDQAVKGTPLDTSALEKKLARIRKVLGEGIVPRDIRDRIQSMFDEITKALDDTTSKNLTKWKHISEQAFLAGVPDLSPAQRRLLEKKFAALGPGGTVPPSSTPAFALQRGDAIVVHTRLDVDGETMARNTTSHQIKRGKKRTVPRAG